KGRGAFPEHWSTNACSSDVQLSASVFRRCFLNEYSTPICNLTSLIQTEERLGLGRGHHLEFKSWTKQNVGRTANRAQHTPNLWCIEYGVTTDDSSSNYRLSRHTRCTTNSVCVVPCLRSGQH